MKVRGYMQRHNPWFKMADDELEAAKRLLYCDYPLLAEALYWCQQSVEKALKGYLSTKNQKLMKTHDLNVLIKLCMNFDNEFNQFEQTAIDLNPLTIITRYPDTGFMIPDLTTSKILYNQAKEFVEFIQNKIGY